MSGLIEHYTRRRRAQADKKAEQPRSDSWDPAETDAARRAPDDGATAWTNGHVTNVQPINRGDRRRRGWRDGVDQEAVSGNGTGSGHDGGDPDGRAGRGGSPNLFDYAAAEEHSAVAEPVPAELNAPAEDYVDTVDYGPAENYAPATEAYAPPTEAYAPPTEEYTAPDLEHEPPAEEPPTPHAAAPDATALQHDASRELAQPEDLVDEDVANWVDATVEGPGYDEPPTVEFRALPTEEPQVDAEARVTAEPVPVDPEPTASVDPEPTATSEPETAAGPGAAAAEPAATDEPAAAPEPRTARAISWRPRRARPLKQAAAVTTPEPPPAAEAATEAAPSPEEPRSRVIHWRANAARQTSAAVPEAPPETPPEETAEIAPAPPPETTDTPFAQIPPADPPPAPHTQTTPPELPTRPRPRRDRPARPKPTPKPTPLPATDAPLGFRERGRVQRRVRFLRHLREVQIRDLGGFVLELHRFGIWRGDLVGLKLAEAAETDKELRALESVLSDQRPVREVREAGIGGSCRKCGAIHGSVDRFCAACGTVLASPTSSARTPGPAAEPMAGPTPARRRRRTR